MHHGRRSIFIVSFLCLAVAHRAAVRAQDPISVGTDKQLILDGLFLATSDNVDLRVHTPRKTGDAIIRREHPWESATLNWFSVVEDQGRIDPTARYRMWYEAYDIDGWPTADDTSFCYAESKDGVHWTKPELGLVSWKGSTRNNILFRQIGSQEHGCRSRVHGTGVFIDPGAAGESRYKAVGQGLFTRPGKRPHTVAGMHSSDGLKWERLTRPLCDVFADSQYSGFWDPSRAKYVLYGRVGGRGRAIGRSESNDFSEFEPLHLVAETDSEDPPNSDLYNAAVIKYAYAPNVYLMFPSLYQHGPDTLDIRLAVSRDGIHWSRPDRATPYIALGEASDFDRGSLYMGQGMIRVENELWMYYSGSPLQHNGADLKELVKPQNERIYSRVVTRLDRFVSATADEARGSFTTPLMTVGGQSLQLNVLVREGGSVRVGVLNDELLPLPGHSLDDCQTIVGDSLTMPVRWKATTESGIPSTEAIRLRFELTDAALFGFQFVSSSPNEHAPRNRAIPSSDTSRQQ